MTTTRVYKSTDAGAPVLTGVVSKMIDLLDAVLVNGYNSKTITITRTGDVATASCVAHGFVAEQVVLISGATPAAYNGEFRVVSAAADTFTFAITGSPATPATGTITCLVAPAGWTKPFTGTDKAVFRNSVASGGSGMYLRVLDDASATGLGRDAKAWVYSSMTDVDTGNDICPSATQMANGVFWRKSTTTDTTARPWQIWADEKTCYVSTLTSTVSVLYWEQNGVYLYAFGDFDSHIAADGYNYFIAGNRDSVNSAGAIAGGFFASRYEMTGSVGAGPADPTAYYIARDYMQVAGPVRAQTFNGGQEGGIYTNAGIGGYHASVFSWPDAGSRMKIVGEAYIIENGCFRGRLRGLWAPYGNVQGAKPAFGARETFADGKVLDIARHDIASGSSYIGFFCIEALASW